jgi:hypothetical protein
VRVRNSRLVSRARPSAPIRWPGAGPPSAANSPDSRSSLITPAQRGGRALGTGDGQPLLLTPVTPQTNISRYDRSLGGCSTDQLTIDRDPPWHSRWTDPSIALESRVPTPPLARGTGSTGDAPTRRGVECPRRDGSSGVRMCLRESVRSADAGSDQSASVSSDRRAQAMIVGPRYRRDNPGRTHSVLRIESRPPGGELFSPTTG